VQAERADWAKAAPWLCFRLSAQALLHERKKASLMRNI